MSIANSHPEDFTRRKFLTGMIRGVLASAVVAGSSGIVETATGQPSVRVNDEQLKQGVKLPPLHAASEQSAGALPLPYSPEHRVGIAVVGLGHLSIGQILPAFGSSKRVRLAGLVSGDPAKAHALPPSTEYLQNPYTTMRIMSRCGIILTSKQFTWCCPTRFTQSIRFARLKPVNMYFARSPWRLILRNVKK